MIQKFIEENDLSFEEGSRNSTIVVLISFAQHLNMTMSKLKTELKQQIEADSFIAEETERLWDYCKNKNYKDFWTKTVAKEQYKF